MLSQSTRTVLHLASNGRQSAYSEPNSFVRIKLLLFSGIDCSIVPSAFFWLLFPTHFGGGGFGRHHRFAEEDRLHLLTGFPPYCSLLLLTAMTREKFMEDFHLRQQDQTAD